jgi:hypothetical protein
MGTMTRRKRGAPGEKRRKSRFRIEAEAKGWQMKEIAERWDISPLSLSRQTREPDQKTLDALHGLPDKRVGDGTEETESDREE